MKKLNVVLCLIVMALLAACAPEQVVVTPSVTPPPTDTLTITPLPSVTPTPSPTPTPFPTLTPTPPPVEVLAEAERHLHNGNFRLAIATYEALLAGPLPLGAPDLHAAAAFGLGEAALRQGQFQTAAVAFSEFLRDYANREGQDARTAWAYLLRGDAYLGLGEWSDAIEDFYHYLQLRPGLIDSYVYERIGDAYLNLGDPEAARTAYVNAIDAGRYLSDLLAMRERAARSYINAGEPLKAVEQYDQILAAAQNPAYRAEIEYLAAGTLQAAGDTQNAINRYLRIFNDYADSPQALQSLIVLLNAEVPVNQYQRGMVNYYNDNYGPCVEAFQNVMQELPAAEIPADVYLYVGRCYLGLGNFDAAVTSFQTILEGYAGSDVFGKAWLEQARVLALQERTVEAIQKYVALAEQHPELDDGAEAMAQAAALFEAAGETERALATYEILGANYPGTPQAVEGMIKAAAVAEELAQYDRTERLLVRVAGTAQDGEQQARAWLQVGRLRQMKGDEPGARIAYESAQGADPWGYYGIRAADILRGWEPFKPPTSYRFTFDDDAQRIEAERWLRERLGLQIEGPLWPVGDILGGDPRLIRGEELWKTGHYAEARAEFEALREAYVGDALASYRLAIYFRQIGIYRSSIIAGAQLIRALGMETLDVPPYIARLRYAIYYQDLLLPNADQYNLDPLLVASIIRQESLFEAFATSYAAAQGLMQVIPTTGTYIAAKLNWPDYQNEDLYRPYVSIAFGTYYIAEQLATFDGHVYAALAAYNGGPANAAQWLESSGGDPDLFLEAVDFAQTRDYIRYIYQQYAIYRALYGR